MGVRVLGPGFGCVQAWEDRGSLGLAPSQCGEKRLSWLGFRVVWAHFCLTLSALTGLLSQWHQWWRCMQQMLLSGWPPWSWLHHIRAVGNLKKKKKSWLLILPFISFHLLESLFIFWNFKNSFRKARGLTPNIGNQQVVSTPQHRTVWIPRFDCPVLWHPWNAVILSVSALPFHHTKEKRRKLLCVVFNCVRVIPMKLTFSLDNLHATYTRRAPELLACSLDFQGHRASELGVCIWDLPVQSWQLNSGHPAASLYPIAV